MAAKASLNAPFDRSHVVDDLLLHQIEAHGDQRHAQQQVNDADYELGVEFGPVELHIARLEELKERAEYYSLALIAFGGFSCLARNDVAKPDAAERNEAEIAAGEQISLENRRSDDDVSETRFETELC